MFRFIIIREEAMLAFYEPLLNLSDPEHHNTMGAILSLRDPVDGDILSVLLRQAGIQRK